MTRLRVLLSRIRATLSGRRRDQQLRDEIETHLALLEDEIRRQGMSADEAARRLVAERWTTAAAVGILALGVGSTVVMADMLDRLLVRPPAHIDAPDRVRRIYTHLEGGRTNALVTFYAAIEHLERGLAPNISHVAAFMREEIGYGRGLAASRFRAVTHSRCYFDVLGLAAHRGALPGCSGTRQPDTVVISHAVWQQHFGGRDDVLGRTMRLGTRTCAVAAVTPPGFNGVDHEPADIWLPLESRADDGALMKDWRTEAAYAMLQVLARLRSGVDVGAAEARATTVYNAGPRLGWADGKTRTSHVRLGELLPARQPGGTDEVRVSLGIAAVSAFVLLIACGNVGNLLFVRGLRRGRELAVKTALGATRGRLFRELIVEAALLALLASGAALAVVQWGGAAVRALLLSEGAMTGAGIDMRVLTFTLAVSLAATLALGLLPALRLVARANLMPGRSIARERPSLLLDSYVALQVALSVPLLAGAAVFGLSLWHAAQVDFGMSTSRVAIVSTNMVEIGEKQRNHRVHRDMQARLALLPQVTAISGVEVVPMRGARAHFIDAPGTAVKEGDGTVFTSAVDPAFFSLMGIHIVAGRTLDDDDGRATSRPVAVVNLALERRFWPGSSAVGKCVRVMYAEGPCVEIVGVVKNTTMWPSIVGFQDAQPMTYFPLERYADFPGDRALLVRTTEPPSGLADLLRRQAATAGPDLPHIQVSAFDDIFLPALRPLRLGSTVFALFSLMALVIAGAGLAAVTASSVARRTREFGIRLALGADPARLVRMVLLRSLAAAVAGLAAGTALSIAGERALRSVLYGVREGDVRPVVAAAIVLAIIAAVAAWLPARRAGQVDPVVALRTD